MLSWDVISAHNGIWVELQVATLYVLAVHWSIPDGAHAQRLWKPVPGDARNCQEMLSFFCLWCAEFSAYMSSAMGCQIICLGSLLRLPRGCQSQCLVVLGIAKRCRVFWPVMMCRVFCLYVMSYGLPHYMSRQSAEAAKRLLMWVPGGAEHCQEMPSFLACDVPSFLTICHELWAATLYVWAVHWSFPDNANDRHWQEMLSFLPVMCWVFCPYCLRYGLPHYMFQHSTEAA